MDLEVKDVSNDYVTVHETSTGEFSEEGEWEINWDTTQLRNDAEYQLRLRSYDGIDYSSWADVIVWGMGSLERGGRVEQLNDVRERPDRHTISPRKNVGGHCCGSVVQGTDLL